jgi:isopenicillin N synthase-like dioxygenase
MDDRLSLPEDGSPFLSPNQWPTQQQLPDFKQLMEDYVGQMKQVRDK